MSRLFWLGIIGFTMIFLETGCASRSESDRHPAGYSRAGREYRPPRAMNHRRMDTDMIYNRCLGERSEMYCRNRMGR